MFISFNFHCSENAKYTIIIHGTSVPHCKGGYIMEYLEYMKQIIIETIPNTKDTELIQLIYGMFMKSDTIQVEYPSAS